MPKEIQELMDNGYWAEKSVVEKVEHPYTRYIPILLERKINKITLQVTQSVILDVNTVFTLKMLIEAKGHIPVNICHGKRLKKLLIFYMNIP